MNIPHLIASLKALGYPVDDTGEHAGVIVALKVPAVPARRVAVPGGTPEDEMHVTLAYLGNVDEFRDARVFLDLARMLSGIAANSPAILARFGGPGRFLGVNDGKDACYLNVDAPHLPRLREQVVQGLEAHGVSINMEHGFTPHVTLTYQAPNTPHPLETPVEGKFIFPTLGLWIGGMQVNLPFLSTPQSVVSDAVHQAFSPLLAKAEQGTEADDPHDTASARELLALLGGDLAHLDRQDAAINQATDALRGHHQHAFEGLTSGIPAVRGSALEDAALHHAGEAGGARRTGAMP